MPAVELDRMASDNGSRHLRFVIIGAGMAGILAAVQLGEHGFNDFVILEKADRLGGTWRENTYPGSELWATRPYSYLSVSIPGIPNLFMPNGPNGPVGNFSLIEVAELQLSYILELVALLRSGKCRALSASVEATDRFEEERVAAAAGTVWATECHSWYLDNQRIPMAWPWTFQWFREAMAEPDLTDFDLVV